MNNPWSIALQMELDGQEYYKKLEQTANREETKQIFAALAADEERHHQVILRIKESGDYHFEEGSTADQVRKVFSQELNAAEVAQAELNHVDAYELAIGMEEKSVELYTELANRAKDDEEMRFFQRLVAEEQGHRTILWKLKELIRRPEEWYPYLDL